jgi:hypothetical protein
MLKRVGGLNIPGRVMNGSTALSNSTNIKIAELDQLRTFGGSTSSFLSQDRQSFKSSEQFK